MYNGPCLQGEGLPLAVVLLDHEGTMMVHINNLLISVHPRKLKHNPLFQQNHLRRG